MRTSKEIGNVGEDVACRYLEAQGFRILHRNLRIGHLETDIVCENDEYILFVEVKTRRAIGAVSKYGKARDAVTEQKKKHLLDGAREYLRAGGVSKRPRIDLVEVYLSREEGPLVKWIKNILR